MSKFTNIKSNSQENWRWWDGPWCNCINLKYAAIPNVPELISLEKSTWVSPGYFEGCAKLEYVKFYTTTLTTLGSKSFYGCTNPNLKIDLNNSPINTLNSYCFKEGNFKNLESLFINYDFNQSINLKEHQKMFLQV